MDQTRNKFPHDPDDRIQKLYYDVNIHIIFNRTKLQNVKNKFWKYLKYLQKKYKNDIQPKLLELEIKRDEAYKECQIAKRISLIHNPTPENVEKRKALVPIFRKANEEYEVMKCEEHFYDEVIGAIMDKLVEFKTQQKTLKHYKNCSHCEKMEKVTNCGCKSNHKLCSDCIDDITECPVCNEYLDLVYCNICYEYKKEIVKTGCKNEHKTCKDCLDKIIGRNNKCPFCRDSCSKEPPVRTFVEGTQHTVEEMEQPYSHGRGYRNEEYYERIADALAGERLNIMHGVREEEEEEEEDRRESMRERVREHRADTMR